jgi:hypothetical protein
MLPRFDISSFTFLQHIADKYLVVSSILLNIEVMRRSKVDPSLKERSLVGKTDLLSHM